MTQPLEPRTPRPTAVFAEQVRFVGSAFRREAVVAAIILIALLFLPRSTPVRFSRELGPMLAVLGLVAPFVLWKVRPGEGDLWLLPVDQRRLAVMRVAAGWLWLMVVAGAVLLWLSVLILLTGGDFAGEQIRLVLDRPIPRFSPPIDPGELRSVIWKTPLWLWLVPPAAATITYLLSSSLVLATDRVWRWLSGAVLVFALLLLATDFQDQIARGLETVTKHRYGVETLVAGGALGQGRTVQLATTHRYVQVWNDLPRLGPWATVTLAWLVAGILTLWLATLRYRECGRPRTKAGPPSARPRNTEPR